MRRQAKDKGGEWDVVNRWQQQNRFIDDEPVGCRRSIPTLVDSSIDSSRWS